MQKAKFIGVLYSKGMQKAKEDDQSTCISSRRTFCTQNCIHKYTGSEVMSLYVHTNAVVCRVRMGLAVAPGMGHFLYQEHARNKNPWGHNPIGIAIRIACNSEAGVTAKE